MSSLWVSNWRFWTIEGLERYFEDNGGAERKLAISCIIVKVGDDDGVLENLIFNTRHSHSRKTIHEFDKFLCNFNY